MATKTEKVKESHKLKQLADWYAHYGVWLQEYAECMRRLADVLQHKASVMTLFESEESL